MFNLCFSVIFYMYTCTCNMCMYTCIHILARTCSITCFHNLSFFVCLFYIQVYEHAHMRCVFSQSRFLPAEIFPFLLCLKEIKWVFSSYNMCIHVHVHIPHCLRVHVGSATCQQLVVLLISQFLCTCSL